MEDAGTGADERGMSLAAVVGTRPEITKMAPILLELASKQIEFKLIHTGQHYDYDMSKAFIHDLGIAEPAASFELHSNNPAAQIGEIMVQLERVLSELKCQFLLIQGDTNSMLAAAVTGVKLNIRIAHVEAGLRSYDWRMPEEHNRRMVDHISDFLLAPTELSRRNLLNELVHGEIHVTGNTVIDAVRIFMPLAERKSQVMNRIRFSEFALATMHRAENVDNQEVLGNCLKAFMKASIPIVFPVHPRTSDRIREIGLSRQLESAANVQLLPPLGYLDFMLLMKKCKMILTDSGGIQEEATSPFIRKPVLVLRRSTERPEAVECGFAKLVDLDTNAIIQAAKEINDNPPKLTHSSPYGDGEASQKIVNVISRSLPEQI